MQTAEVDLADYGASGFCRQAGRSILASHSGGAKSAMAGRGARKLALVSDLIGAGSDTPIVIADATDTTSLNDKVRRPKDFVYDKMVLATIGVAGRAIVHALAVKNPLGIKAVPIPGEGPSRQERESGFTTGCLLLRPRRAGAGG